jgi:transcriptional regulator with XRE-family HTH domain
MTLRHGADTFTDVFLLVRADGQWRSANTAYHRHQPDSSPGVAKRLARSLGIVTETPSIGDRLRETRKRRGLTQRELARLSGLSVSLVRKLEQDDYGDIRLETVHRLAVVLRVPTSALASGDAPVPDQQSVARWEQVRRALEEPPQAQPSEEPTLAGVRETFGTLVPLLLASRFAEMATVLPALLRDADALVACSADGTLTAARTLRAQVRQMAGALMLHAWQFDVADSAFALAMTDAGDTLTACSVAEEQCWGLVRQGRLADCQALALRWADEAEPKMTAKREELAAWGRLLLRASSAAVRDNQPVEAGEMLRLAGMAAAGTSGDFWLPYAPQHVFGPVTVSVMAAEHAMIQDRPGVTLAIAREVEGARMPVPRIAPSHKLDVAAAHAALRQDNEAVGVLQDLRRTRPQWLPQQRYASDILHKVVTRRRSLTPEMRDLAEFLSLSL